MRNAIATMLLLSAAPLLAQDQPGEAWLELPEVWPEVGQAYVVNLHLNTGAQEPDTLQMHLNFDTAVLQLAFSAATGFPPVFTNPDLALGGSLTAAGTTDLQAVHPGENPGQINILRAGGSGDAWDLSGDIDMLQITFHPQSTVLTQITGEITVLRDASLVEIGAPAVIVATIGIPPIEDLAADILAGFDAADANGDDALTLAEVQTLIPQLTADQFAAIDSDTSGGLSLAEINGAAGPAGEGEGEGEGDNNTNGCPFPKGATTFADFLNWLAQFLFIGMAATVLWKRRTPLS